VVYLTAYVPWPASPTGATLASLSEGQSSISGTILIGDPRVTGAQRINPRDTDPAYLEKGRQALYNDVSTEQYLRFISCNPDLLLAVAFDDAHGTPKRWGRIPRAFVRCTEDHTVPWRCRTTWSARPTPSPLQVKVAAGGPVQPL
jgi:hypothetical protein